MEVLLNNQDSKVIDKLNQDIKRGSSLYIISTNFSIFAYSELKKKLDNVEKVYFLFLKRPILKTSADSVREFEMTTSFAENICELQLKKYLNQSFIAKECSSWVIEKVEMKAYREGIAHHNNLCIIEGTVSSAIMGAEFTAVGLGILPSSVQVMSWYSNNVSSVQTQKQYFNQCWNDKNKVEDIKEEFLESLELVYKENSPEELYYKTLYNIFHKYAHDFSEKIIKEKTGFKESLIWNKLYNFQKDGVLGCIDKLEKYNGCILADSVGLGKTFEALAVIKYYESRNYKVLVLCPKKLRENWLAYKGNRKDNILLQDRFNYDVLHHSDLTRKSGYTGDIDLNKVYWENYDVIVIDESHNFRNSSNVKEGQHTRYSKLLHEIIKKGIKTKVLMLSATPVNQKMNDLKSQIAFITEGNDNQLEEEGIVSISNVLKNAQAGFNVWIKLPKTERTIEKLQEMLSTDYFRLLDIFTIARSRKHIQKYYDTSNIGKFPERLPPINIQTDITEWNKCVQIEELNKSIEKLTLAMYSPLAYVLPHKLEEYSKKYDTKTDKSILKQTDREQSLIHLMRVNILKRMESSIHSFRVTLKKIIEGITTSLTKLERAQYVEEKNIELLDLDENEQDNLFVNNKVKVYINDIDKIRWKQELLYDKEILEGVMSEVKDIIPERDTKLQKLIALIKQKIENPINSENKKILIFTAFADTALYLYDNIATTIMKEFNIHTGLITGNQVDTTLQISNKNFHSILLNFSPYSKERGDIHLPQIDILIATDCISEGQNLQDCDYLINYDIHWNPVRIVQRFGRIDRIGSKNTYVQLVNFWPNMELDEYINLEQRVRGRMDVLNISSTGEENIIQESSRMNDLNYRKEQLQKLKNSDNDFDDITGKISITDLSYNSFKISLFSYLKEKRTLIENMPEGVYAIAQADNDIPKGVIFCLKKIHEEEHEHNILAPYFIVYVLESGEIHYSFTQSKQTLDIYRKLCEGKCEVYHHLIEKFNQDTNDAQDMMKYTRLLEKAVENIMGKVIEKGIDSLFSLEPTQISNDLSYTVDDFELVSFLIIE